MIRASFLLWYLAGASADNIRVNMGWFPFNKNSVLKFRKFHVFNGTVHSGCSDSTQATARLVIVLVSRIQKSGTGDNNFVEWKETFRSDRSKWTTFKAAPKYSGRIKPKWSVLFDAPTEISGIGLNGKRAYPRGHSNKSQNSEYSWCSPFNQNTSRFARRMSNLFISISLGIRIDLSLLMTS